MTSLALIVVPVVAFAVALLLPQRDRYLNHDRDVDQG